MKTPRYLRIPFLGLVLALAGCATTPSDLPPLDVSGPGWRVWGGQSVWESRFGDDPLIGEFVSGVSRAEAVSFAELSKGGVPIIRARRSAEKWELQFLPRNLALRGKGGKVPPKWIFLSLPDILSGSQPPEGWIVKHEGRRVILTNAKLKETLELLVEEGSAVPASGGPGFQFGPPH